jgi:diacylglycerol kinase family enzyme
MPGGRAAVVVNPTKFDDLAKFRHTVCAAMAARRWREPLWLETTAGDPGRGMAAKAAAERVDLVLACGGDGTVIACAEGLAGGRIPLAVIPAGTGNLLARNLRLPFGLDDALVVALTGDDMPLDMGSANGKPFVVMAGVGLDAKMLESTSESVKKRFGWAAYVISALRHLRDRPMRVRLRADGGPPLRRRAGGVIVGNVGRLQAGVSLLPDAKPDDGLLDAAVLTARGAAGWLALAGQLLLRRGAAARVARLTFRELRIDLDRPQPWEVDGEVMGRTSQLVINVQAGRLLLRGPAQIAAAPPAAAPAPAAGN